MKLKGGEMEESIRVVTDSSCDLPPGLLKEYAIEVVPLIVHFGTDTYHDGASLVERFWEKAAGPHLPKTSQPSVGMFEEVFERLVGRGSQVLCVTITGKHSGTFNAAHVAAQRFGEAVVVFDSLSLSLGLGLQVLGAARAAAEGRSMDEILTLLEDLRRRSHLLIVLDTLEYLRHGGRADAFMAVADRMTQALNIRVIINLVEGQLRLLSAARSFEGALKRVLNLVEGLGPLEQMAVVHTRNHKTAERMVERLATRANFPKERVWMRETGAVLASHAGPGVIGVLAVPAVVGG
jgi:DegV family protein with EDD domain